MDPNLPLRTENEVRRTQVINSIRNGNLVVVVGTGVSIESLDRSVGIPEVAGWQGLLKNGLDRCYHLEKISDKAREIVEAEIEEGSVEFLISAAQKIVTRLDQRIGEKGLWLEETIGQLVFSKPGLIQAIADLGGILATLNYDDLLRQVTGRKTYHWRNLSEVNELIRDKQTAEFILHLHGHWKDPDSVILDGKSYDSISTDIKFVQHFREFTLSRTLLFVGCGNTFMDPNLQAWLVWAKSAMAGEKHRHYILCRAGERQNFYRQLPEHGYLTPLFYGETYEDLEPFLVKLRHDATKTTTTPEEPSVVTVSGGVEVPSKATKLSDSWPR